MSFPVIDRNGAEYVALVDILDQFGSAKTKQSDSKFHVKFAPRSGSTIEAEFNQNSTAAKIGGRKIELSSPFLILSDRGMVPTSSLPQLASSFLGIPVSFHQTARRLFVGAVSNPFTYDLQKAGGPRLVLHFSAPVSPSIATEPGRLRMTFAKDPVVSNAPAAALADSTFSSLSYSESNGAAEISVAATAPLLASFSDSGRTVTITAQQSAPAVSSASNLPATASPNLTNVPVPVPTPPRFLIVIDAAHGGADPGAAITPTLSEKDVVLAFARRLKTVLDNQGVATVLLRDSDSTLSFDQRTAGREHLSCRTGDFRSRHLEQLCASCIYGSADADTAQPFCAVGYGTSRFSGSESGRCRCNLEGIVHAQHQQFIPAGVVASAEQLRAPCSCD